MPRRNKQKYNAQPSPPTQLPTPLPEEERRDDRLIDFDSDVHDVHTYRSPPFREVHSSDLEQDPLPVLPRSYHKDDDDYDSVTGHTRWPTYSR
jgi:hypothetical protein